MVNLPNEQLIVVARYDEDVSWCNELSIPYIIFNKGRNDLPANLKTHNLVNIGREGHTILHFIISNYDNLPNRILFTQADPFPHAPRFLNSIKQMDSHLPVQPLSVRYLEPKDPKLRNRPEFESGIPPQKILNQHMVSTNGVEYYTEILDGCFNVISPYQYSDPGIQCLSLIQKHHQNSVRFVCRSIGIDEMETIHFSYGGILSVRKEQILRHKKETYEKMMRFLLETPEHGFLMERMWLTIFGYQPLESVD